MVGAVGEILHQTPKIAEIWTRECVLNRIALVCLNHLAHSCHSNLNRILRPSLF